MQKVLGAIKGMKGIGGDIYEQICSFFNFWLFSFNYYYYIYKKIRAKKIIKKAILPSEFEYLVNVLKNEDVAIKEEAINKLGELEDPRSADALIEFINLPEVKEEEDGYMASFAINSLFLKDDKRAIDFLINSLKEGDFGFRFLICRGILSLSEERKDLYKDAIEPLNKYINELLEAKERKDPAYFKDYLDAGKKALEKLKT